MKLLKKPVEIKTVQPSIIDTIIKMSQTPLLTPIKSQTSPLFLSSTILRKKRALDINEIPVFMTPDEKEAVKDMTKKEKEEQEKKYLEFENTLKKLKEEKARKKKEKKDKKILEEARKKKEEENKRAEEIRKKIEQNAEAKKEKKKKKEKRSG